MRLIQIIPVLVLRHTKKRRVNSGMYHRRSSATPRTAGRRDARRSTARGHEPRPPQPAPTGNASWRTYHESRPPRPAARASTRGRAAAFTGEARTRNPSTHSNK
ncbi:hypothetical protein GOBAR_AA29810 [Gossypium barbadense]|uniref:Uncharacterized protein n=1 Tax=Gossypium barbadense TaxID=3634 RepID=A0A2P5WIG0_GOSBA|nr:hypothetical protein GOBAR_AA29810 [Gossypium barbadense]